VLEYWDLTERIIGIAIEVDRNTGPGLLESVYAACMCLELGQAGIPLSRQVAIPVSYKGVKILWVFVPTFLSQIPSSSRSKRCRH